MNINPSLDTWLTNLAKSAKLDETDTTKIAVMALSDLAGIAYVPSTRGRSVDIEKKQFDLQTAKADRDWYVARNRKVPSTVSDRIADLERVIAAAQRDNPIPQILTDDILTDCLLRHKSDENT